MRIEKLYTLSQLVEYLYSEHEFHNKADSPSTLNGQKAYYFDLIVNYMQFLQTPLKKEMFVNELKEPSRYHQFQHGKFLLLNKENLERCHEFEEAEKKVIFEECKRAWSEDDLDVFEVNVKETQEIEYYHNRDKFYYGNEEIELNSLRDLANATNGLITKNIEL